MDTVAGTLAGYGGWERTWKTSFFLRRVWRKMGGNSKWADIATLVFFEKHFLGISAYYLKIATFFYRI